jgi:hypothetical protein
MEKNYIITDFNTQWVVLFNHQSEGIKRGRTVMVFSKAEGISGPSGHQSIAISAECMQYHILDAVWLRRAPDHNIEPILGLWSEQISAEGGEVWSWQDATWCWTLMMMVLTSIGFWAARRSQEEGSIEIEDE